jgi:virulence factor Mce-like protein
VRQGRASAAASPVLIGALTTLVLIVAVFLAYNANQGLPFVPTYDLKVEVRNAQQLVVGNDVRVGGVRVGAVDDISPVRREDGSTRAVLSLKLENRVKPLPRDSVFTVRPRSALGLKYVEVRRGSSEEGWQAGATVPYSEERTPGRVEIDNVFNMFNERTREGSRESLEGIGDGLTGRGVDINIAIGEFPTLFLNLQAVMTNLSDEDTQIGRLFRELADAAEIVAPAAETQAALFGNLETTFAALSSVRPELQETISEGPETMDVGIRELPLQRPFLRNSAALARELRPGVAALPSTLPDLADALEFGVSTLRRSPAFNRQVASSFRALQRFAEDPRTALGIQRLRDTVASLRPTLRYLTPIQTVCNYPTLWFRNIGNLLSETDGNGTWQRFIIVATPTGPNNEGGPSSAPANGPQEQNYLHANPYPNAASPGVTRECEAGNEDYLIGRQVIGNLPGAQDVETSGQEVGE